MNKNKILIVDDEPSVRESLRMVLKDRYETLTVSSGQQVFDLLDSESPDVILLDILMPGLDGLEVLEKVRQRPAPPQVIMVTATKTVKTAVTAMKLGAFHYITKPFDVEELLLTVDRAVESRTLAKEVHALRAEVGTRYRFDNIIGNSAKFQTSLRTVAMVAPLKTTVLVTGESGTGKELVARAIHYNSPRAQRPLVTINCAAIPENLIESELFGHEKGAFTDAYAKKLGQFEVADQATLFLDEIGELPANTQAKLLRVLEQSEFTRVGGTSPIKVDVRIIAATNRDLHDEMREGNFRADLFYRLNVVSVHLPPLRDRRDDVAILVRHFLSAKATELGLPEKAFNNDAMDLLLQYAWPGNVRELENVIERTLVLSEGDIMQPSDLPQYMVSGNTQTHPLRQSVLRGEIRLGEAVDQFEIELIRAALNQTGNNQTRAADLLGTTRRILKYKMDKLGISGGEESGLDA